jgi:hypothetical protein
VQPDTCRLCWGVGGSSKRFAVDASAFVLAEDVARVTVVSSVESGHENSVDLSLTSRGSMSVLTSPSIGHSR